MSQTPHTSSCPEPAKGERFNNSLHPCWWNLCYNTMDMENQAKFQLPERNPVTHAAHRREVFWQITFPFLIALIILLGLVAGVIFAGTTGAGMSAAGQMYP